MSRSTVSMDISMSAQVAMLRIYPSIMASTVRHFLQLPVRGVVLQCYGAGNIPSDRTHPTPAMATPWLLFFVCEVLMLSFTQPAASAGL